MLNMMFTYKESLLLDQEFVVEFNITVEIYIPAIVACENFPV